MRLLNFRPFLPVKIIFGTGRIKIAGKLIKGVGRKALVVIGRGSVKKYGYLDNLIASLKDEQVDFEIFEGIEENPTVEKIDRGGRFARESDAEVVIGFGGGSVMDAAKGISIVAKNSGSIWDYMAFIGKQGKK